MCSPGGKNHQYLEFTIGFQLSVVGFRVEQEVKSVELATDSR